MKKISLLAILGVMALTYSCKKEKSIDENALLNSSIEAKTATGLGAAKMGEPVEFSVKNNTSTPIWSVTPNNGVKLISSEGNKAKFTFSVAGLYTVNAKYSSNAGSVNTGTGFEVKDSSYSPKDSGWIYSSLNGDNLSLTPSLTTINGSQVLLISAKTQNSYNCLNNYLIANRYDSFSVSKINYSGVASPGNCQAGQQQAKANSVIEKQNDGNYLFEVLANGVSYKGSFNKTGQKYTFTWPYNSGVTISPLTVQ